MDETSVCLFQGDGKGTVFANKRQPGGQPVQKVAKSKRRCCLTHVGLICDNPTIQAVLPQVIVGNFRTFLASQLAELQANCPGNVTLIRQKSAWNNSKLCAKIIRWLGKALAPYKGQWQPILLFDAARLHLSKKVFRACSAAGVWPVVVPAKTTWLLQPLDVDAFQQYKAHLKRAYQKARASAGGDLSVGQFLGCVYATIRRTLQGRLWARTFDKVGFGASQAKLSSFVERQLQLQGPVCIPALRPSEEQVAHCFPKGAALPMATLFPPRGRPVSRLGALEGGLGAALVTTDRPGGSAKPRGRYLRLSGIPEATVIESGGDRAGAASSSGGPLLGRTRAETRRLLSAAADRDPRDPKLQAFLRDGPFS